MVDDKMTTRRPHYTQQAKDLFWKRLGQYRTALESGAKTDIIATSLAIHAALGDVPPSFKKYVNKVFRDTVRTTPL